MRKQIAILLLAAMSGCASTPADVKTAPRAKASSVLDPALLNESADKGTIRIIRDRGVFGSGISVLIYVDGRHVANVDANRVLDLHVAPGARRLGLQTNNVTEPIQYQEVNVQAGATYEYRVGMTGNGITTDWRMERIH